MSSSSIPPEAPNPQSILDAATGFMRAKHLFVAAELGIFEALGDGPSTLDQLAQKLNLPQRTARISLDAVTALGFLEREGALYRNAPAAQAFLSGRGAADMRPFIRLWNRLSYRRWLTLEDSIRQGRGVAGEFNFSPDEEKIFLEGVEAWSGGQAAALANAYDFSGSAQILDLGGGTGSFLVTILQHHSAARCTLYELPEAAAVARERLRAIPPSRPIEIVSGNFLKDPIPQGHDTFIVANVVHTLTAEQNKQLVRRVREAAPRGARLLLVDLWTNPAHTEPQVAAIMAGEFLVQAGNGDVYSTEEAMTWLTEGGWSFVEQKPLDGPVSVIVAEAS